MGLPAPVIDYIFDEHSRRPIRGDIGFIAKQSTFATEKSLRHLSKKYNIQAPSDFQIEFDKQSRSALGDQFVRRLLKRILKRPRLNLISDKCLMHFLGVKSFSTIDVSDYEGADIICDLSQPLPESLYQKFDFIFNGSCLDNIFNPAEALRNISRMLKPNGRLVMIEHGTMANGPYTVFSPGWFFDYFCCNKYQDCRVYHGLFKNNTDLHYGPWPLYLYNWRANKLGISPTVRSRDHIMYLIVAEKGKNSTDEFFPIQYQYRDPTFEKAAFFPQVVEMLNQTKPSFGISGKEFYDDQTPFINCGYLGSGTPF